MDNRQRAAERICSVLSDAGHRALLAGGCVRDMLLGREPTDYDIATSAYPQAVAELFPKVISVGAAYGVQIVLLPEGPFEVTTFRSDGPYLDGRHPQYVEFRGEREDALRRDFTINAMFFDPATQAIVDYVNGRADLDARRIRAVGDPRARFHEDHLRLLRAVRFAARFGFAIDQETFTAMRELASSVAKTSPERIRDEIVKMLTEGAAKKAFELLDECELLEHVLPEVARMKGVEQPPEFHPEGDVFTHTLLMLDFVKNPSPALALAILLHDVGKPLTMTVSDRIRFNNHDKVGAEEAARICRRLHATNDETETVVWLVSQHMRLAHAPKMRESKRKRFVREKNFALLLELCRIDCLASHADMSVIEWLADYVANLKPEELRPEAVLCGADLIEMGFAPGPVFSEILSAVEDSQLEGALTSKGEAMEFVLRQWSPKNTQPD